jgi:hypothetical protein
MLPQGVLTRLSSHALHEIALARIFGLTSPIMHFRMVSCPSMFGRAPSQLCIMTYGGQATIEKESFDLDLATWNSRCCGQQEYCSMSGLRLLLLTKDMLMAGNVWKRVGRHVWA